MLPTVKDIVQQIRKELAGIYPAHEAFQYTWLLIEYLRGWSKTEMMLHDHTKLTLSEHIFIEKALERLKNHEPIQYILSETEFFGLKFSVDRSVLIPRPETEELVEWILRESQNKTSFNILDIGTGSGIIAVTLGKLLPHADVEGWDISLEALQKARSNAIKNKVTVDFQCVDILAGAHSVTEKYDIIVSNPPYVRESEQELMSPNVLNFEPHEALFVDDNDPLVFYRAIGKFSIKSLKPGGKLFLEINRDFGSQTRELLKQEGFSQVDLRSDLSGNHRMIRAVKGT